MRKDITPDVDRAGSVLFDSSWSSGSLSFAHHGLEDNCEVAMLMLLSLTQIKHA